MERKKYLVDFNFCKFKIIFLFEKNTYSDQSVPISPNFYFRFLMQDHPPPEENTVPRFFMSTAIAMLADKES